MMEERHSDVAGVDGPEPEPEDVLTGVRSPDHEPTDQDDREVPLDDPEEPEVPVDEDGEPAAPDGAPPPGAVA